ncbi:MAG: hypothetical protein CMM86_00475 [Rhodovulum sp.]|nr:hypothetical protein [Rhodovulum sp.]
MTRFAIAAATALAMADATGTAMADPVCTGEILFQCATGEREYREQITVCMNDGHYSLNRHRLATGDPFYDIPLIADADTTWFQWSEGDVARLELGFWHTDMAEPVTLHLRLPWDDLAEEVIAEQPVDMWLQSPHWRQRVDQTVCDADTVYADPEPLWSAQVDRGPIGAFFSQDVITPQIDTVGIARVSDVPKGSEGLPVYASARPRANTPVWWMLQPMQDVDVLAREGAFIAVALPTRGIDTCTIRPEQIGHPYTGPCATGWVDGAFLKRIQ